MDKGQIYGLLGPNGAGKSTTMNIITGYISATDGTAEIDGCDIFDSPAEARAKIGYLPGSSRRCIRIGRRGNTWPLRPS